jgi:hypothetical protein
MISLFTEKENEKSTLKLYRTLEKLDLPEDVNITINNMEGAESGILRKGGLVVDISLSNCFSLEDVVRELVMVVSRESVGNKSE